MSLFENKRRWDALMHKEEVGTLLVLDEGNYTEDMLVVKKDSVRALIIRDGRIAVQRGMRGDCKLLGGGVEEGETFEDALVREVLEEGGLIVRTDTIRPLGRIEEKRRDIFEPDKVYVCHSYYYACDVEAETVGTHMTESELAKGYHLEWKKPKDIICDNANFAKEPWIYRDTEFVKLLAVRQTTENK